MIPCSPYEDQAQINGGRIKTRQLNDETQFSVVEEEFDDIVPTKLHGKSAGSVLPSVGIFIIIGSSYRNELTR
ncbi:hypothetical protein AgCh_022521 [Apium graveolens]